MYRVQQVRYSMLRLQSRYSFPSQSGTHLCFLESLTRGLTALQNKSSIIKQTKKWIAQHRTSTTIPPKSLRLAVPDNWTFNSETETYTIRNLGSINSCPTPASPASELAAPLGSPVLNSESSCGWSKYSSAALFSSYSPLEQGGSQSRPQLLGHHHTSSGSMFLAPPEIRYTRARSRSAPEMPHGQCHMCSHLASIPNYILSVVYNLSSSSSSFSSSSAGPSHEPPYTAPPEKDLSSAWGSSQQGISEVIPSNPGLITSSLFQRHLELSFLQYWPTRGTMLVAGEVCIIYSIRSA